MIRLGPSDPLAHLRQYKGPEDPLQSITVILVLLIIWRLLGTC